MASLNEHYRATRPSCDRSSEISVVLGKRIQGCATSNARFEPRDCSQFSRWVQQLRAAATRDKSFFLSREALAAYTNAPPAPIKNRPARLGARITQPSTRF